MPVHRQSAFGAANFGGSCHWFFHDFSGNFLLQLSSEGLFCFITRGFNGAVGCPWGFDFRWSNFEFSIRDGLFHSFLLLKKHLFHLKLCFFLNHWLQINAWHNFLFNRLRFPSHIFYILFTLILAYIHFNFLSILNIMLWRRHSLLPLWKFQLAISAHLASGEHSPRIPLLFGASSGSCLLHIQDLLGLHLGFQPPCAHLRVFTWWGHEIRDASVNAGSLWALSRNANSGSTIWGVLMLFLLIVLLQLFREIAWLFRDIDIEIRFDCGSSDSSHCLSYFLFLFKLAQERPLARCLARCSNSGCGSPELHFGLWSFPSTFLLRFKL